MNRNRNNPREMLQLVRKRLIFFISGDIAYPNKVGASFEYLAPEHICLFFHGAAVTIRIAMLLIETQKGRASNTEFDLHHPDVIITYV